MTSTDKTEPPGSASSSPDDLCTCGHVRTKHFGDFLACSGCRRFCEAFVPAEPEAPECSHESWDERNPQDDHEGHLKVSRWCTGCGAYLGRYAPTFPVEEFAMPIGPASVPRRPPYAVAYDLQDGTQYEVALPGDATVCALDGALIITHSSSPVKGLTQVQPFTTEQ